MKEILKKIKEMKFKSFDILNHDSNEAINILFSLDDEYAELIEMIEEKEDEMIIANQLEYEQSQGEDI